MRTQPVLLLTFALFSTGLAGCMGHGAGKASPSPTESDPYALPEGVTNLLQGTVVGVDQIPIENVSMEVLSVGLNHTTDESGFYRFESLEPRDYLIVAAKDGYRTKTQRAIIEDGKIFVLNFQLDEKPLLQPYNTTVPFRGLVSCQFSYATNPENVQRQDCGSVDPTNKCCKEFDLVANGAQVQVEAFWVPKTELCKKLVMGIESVGFGHQDVIFGEQSGVSGMKMTVSQSLLQKYYPQGGVMRVSLYSAPSVTGDEAALDVGACFQQDFEIYFTVFYVDPGPTNFSARPA